MAKTHYVAHNGIEPMDLLPQPLSAGITVRATCSVYFFNELMTFYKDINSGAWLVLK